MGTLPANPPVNADARVRATMCVGWPVRAGYWARCAADIHLSPVTT